MADMELAAGIDLLEQRDKLVRALLWLGLAVSGGMLVGQVAELQGIVSLDDNLTLASASGAYGLLSVLDILLVLVTFVCFGMWIYRAAANVTAADVRGFDYTPGWAVGWFFIPFANLVKPFQAMRQIWNASHGESAPNLDNGDKLLTIWWTTWLLSSIATNVGTRMIAAAQTPETLRSGLQISIVGTAISLPLYWAAIQLVARITRAQRERLTAAHIFA